VDPKGDEEGGEEQQPKKPRAAYTTKGSQARDIASWMAPDTPIRDDEELQAAVLAQKRAASNASYARSPRCNNHAKAAEESKLYAYIGEKISAYAKLHPESISAKYRDSVEGEKAKVRQAANKLGDMVCRTLDQSADIVQMFTSAGLNPSREVPCFSDAAPFATTGGSSSSGVPSGHVVISQEVLAQLLQAQATVQSQASQKPGE
jgi:hypothetical protein